ncbi:DNA primase large subunit PriL [Candidatus Hecatella orcuttiae]|jgi:DNA primase large subunit|uniref:DNA primase large subunit PriL n=1 Tax=Candidatus Hecatella orcuttiae TaxID=1935119 RepID=UPI002867EF4E|nr:DNA primase large subunit PriL [Candidatus Hecatella orcuttiae]
METAFPQSSETEESCPLTKLDHAKYPFTREAAEYVGRLGFSLEEVSSPDYNTVIRKAAERILRSAKSVRGLPYEVSPHWDDELLSFPLSLIMIKEVGDAYFQQRFTLQEAKLASARLREEELKKVLWIARKTFKWKISEVREPSSVPYFKLHFVNYLKNAIRFRGEDKWKLTNRKMEYGEIYLNKAEVVRLLEEEIRSHIQERIEKTPRPELPPSLKEAVGKLEDELKSLKKTLPSEEVLGATDSRAFPPCMAELYTAVLGGKNVPHAGRFTLTAFLLSTGMEAQEVARLYTAVTDFDERLTQYQVEHIAGLTGGRTKYKPLNCANMQTHRLCVNKDEICSRIKNPLQYYRIKLKRLRLSR